MEARASSAWKPAISRPDRPALQVTQETSALYEIGSSLEVAMVAVRQVVPRVIDFALSRRMDLCHSCPRLVLSRQVAVMAGHPLCVSAVQHGHLVGNGIHRS